MESILTFDMSGLMSKNKHLEGWEPGDTPLCKSIPVLENVDFAEVGLRILFSACIVLHHLLVLGGNLLAVTALVVLEVEDDGLAVSFFDEGS